VSDELFLIDGNSLAYRAFFALPESIATSTGIPTNAIFGFASMLVKILTEYGPKATVVVWDGGYTGRKEIYPEYKAGRSSRPDLLKEQWPHFEPLVDAFGYRNLRVEGYEADDVIASIAALAGAAENGAIPVMVVTGDRDAYQLVDDHTRIMTTSRGITDTKVYDRQAVIDRYGVTPEQVPDFIGLKGDTSDNIPGVPGIGDKTAAELLQRFGTVDGVLASIDEISGAKRKENLTVHADAARMSKQLATAKRDIPLDLDLAEFVSAEPDRSTLRDTFRQFELRDPLRRLEEALGSAEAAAPARAAAAESSLSASVREITLAQIERLPIAEVAICLVAPEAEEGALFALDAGWKFAVHAKGATEVVVGKCDSPVQLVELLGDRPVLAHDAKALGLVPKVLEHDTEVAAYLLEPARRAYPFRELVEERGFASSLDAPAGDALMLRELADWQREEIRGRGLTDLLVEVELPLVRILRKMELAGLKLNTERLAEISIRVKAEADQLEREIYELAGEEFTLGSPKQLEEILFGKLGLSRKRRGKTGYSTDARVLQAIRDEHPVIPKIERWRELTKLAQTYLDALPLEISAVDGRIHTTFNQTAAATGRLSSNSPNLQNIPIRTPLGKEIRACFVAEPGHLLVSADYSQVELRLLAHIAGEDVLKEIFRRGEDVHTATACRVFGVRPDQIDSGMRSKAKMINYGIVYGLSAYGMADRLDIPQAEADEFIQRYLAGFPAVGAFIEATIEQGTEHGYVSTLLGRRRQVPELRARRWELRKQGERFAVNMVIQGTAADIMKIAMVRADAALSASGLASRLVLQIHDELLFEGPAEEAEEVKALAVREMGAAFEMDPPLETEAGIGSDWLSAK
jgi:DNA polymerase-1